MTDPFTLTVFYKSHERDFIAQLLPLGYSHKFKVLIDDTEVFFEPDEEGSYRAIKMPWQDEKDLIRIDRMLLQAIQEKIEEILS
ncbi:MAG: hypothetical protein JST75_11755 [Bacteroidetes bacterium]|nr:hypothetical protein [Bacteroidota bacterium]